MEPQRPNWTHSNWTNLMPNRTDRSFDPLCRISANLLDTPGLGFLISLIVFLALIAIFLNTILAYVIWKVSLFHSGFRLLLAHISVLCVLYCVASIVKASYILGALVRNDPCSLITDGYRCWLQEIARSWPSQALIYANPAVTLERMYSTWRHDKGAYNQSGGTWPWLLALVLIPLIHLNPILNLVKIYNNGETKVAICEAILSSSYSSARYALVLNLSFAVFSIVLVCILQYFNHTRLKSMLANRALTHTLAARFQLQQNIQITRMLIPSAVLEFLTLLPVQGFSLWITIGSLSYDTKVLLVQTSYLWKMTYCTGYPLVAMLMNTHVKKALIKSTPDWIKRLLCGGGKVDDKVRVIAIGGSGNVGGGGGGKMRVRVHFEMLDTMWEKNRRLKR